MSDEPGSPRKESDAAISLRGAVPKRRDTKKRSKSQRRARSPLPCFEPDPKGYSDVTLRSGDNVLYTSKTLLAWHSKVLEEALEDDPAASGRGRGSQAKGPNKEIDVSHIKFDDVVDLIRFIDPRHPFEWTEEIAMRLAPLAEDYDIQRLKKDCEEKLTSTYTEMRKGKKRGMVPTEKVKQYLVVADKCKYEKLLVMCIEDSAGSPYFDSHFDKMLDDVSGPTQNEILRKRNNELRRQLSKKTREVNDAGGGDSRWRR